MSITQASIDALFSTDGDAAATTGSPAVASDSVAPREELANPDLGRILALSVPLSVTLAERDVSIESILKITVGTILEFDVLFDSELTLNVANRPIGTGQAVKIGENFGLRINSIDNLEHRIDALGGKGDEAS